MRDRGRLTAPGDLLAGPVPASGEDALAAPDESSRSLAELAAEYGLWPSSARPGLASYLAMVWQRRHFILAYATARNVSMYTEARLGQLWQVLTPLLNSAVYYLIFGVLFKANRGISNYTAYLVTGGFIFAFTERSIVVGSSAIRANITLIRALHFPRACLPLSYVLVEFQQLLLSMVVLFAIVLGTGEPLTWYWLLLIPAREAEMAKLQENTYRHVNIALVNEMAIFCRELGIDLHDAIRCAATKPFGFQPFHPAPLTVPATPEPALDQQDDLASQVPGQAG